VQKIHEFLGKIGEWLSSFSLKLKMTVLFSMLLLAFGIITLNVVLSYQKSVLTKAIKEKGELLSINMARNAAHALLTRNKLELSVLVNSMKKTSGVEYCAITDHRGIIQMHSDIREIGKKARIPPEKPNPDTLYFVAPVIHHNKRIGTAYVVLSTRKMKSQLRLFKVNLVFFIVVFMIAGCGILAWLISLFLKPLEELSSAANEVGGGNLNVQANVKSKDEVGQLAITFNQMVINLNSAYTEIEEGYLQAVQSLAMAVEAKDRYTKGHCDRVVFYSTVIAQHMDIAENEIVELQLASQLHDVGKIGVPEALLNKPGKLSPEEMRYIQKHPLIGYQILRPAKFLRGVAKLVLEHHERFDGKGYPKGKKGEEISLAGRILCLADTFDALTSDRPYRRGMPLDKSISIILENKGSQFDPQLVDLFCSLINEGELEYCDEKRDQCLLTDHLAYLRVRDGGEMNKGISTSTLHIEVRSNA
jgi:HD-GYP domain-containing protein (c-di-GMP phosphodiesterase class II)